MSTIPTRSQAPSIVRQGRMPLQGPARPAGAALTGKDVVRILRKRKLLIALSVAIVTTAAAVATLLWGFIAPLYTAEALLAVRRPRTTGLVADTYLPAGEVMLRLLTSTAQVVNRRPVMVAAVTGDYMSSRDLRNTEWYKKDVSSAPVRLQEDINIAALPKADYVRVSMTDRHPEEVAIIVNAVCDAAVDERNTSTGARVDVEISRLTERLEQLRSEQQTAEDLAKAVRKRLETVTEPAQMADWQRKEDAANSKLRMLQERAADFGLARAQAEGIAEALKGLSNEAAAQRPEVRAALEMDGPLQGLRALRRDREIRLVYAEQRYKPMHPVIIGLRREMENTDAQIEQRRAEVVAAQVKLLREQSTIIGLQLSGVLEEIRQGNNEAAQAVREREGLRAKYEAAGEELDRQKLRTDRDVALVVDRTQRVERRLDELRVEKQNRESLELVGKAFPPDKPSWPKWSVMMPLGVVLGLIIGLSLAFTLELVDTSIKSPSDVSRRVDLPLLGMVPHSEDLEDEIPDMRLAFMSAPNSIVAEAYRQIRTTILFSGPAADRRSLLVASSLPGDGRTSVAMNLAGCVARGGHKVLVVDANFRQPAIGDLFPQAPQAGFSSALVGQVDWRQQVHQVEENFYVMLAGPLPPNPAELLGSEQMRKIVQEMEAEYDQVIFDSAPSVVVADSSVLSTEVDGVILVVRAGANTYGIVQRTRDILDRVGAHILGVVLNGMRVTAGGYLRKNYETFYQYHQQPRLTGSQAPTA